MVTCDAVYDVPPTFMVTSMFKDFQVGRATAIAVMLFVLVLAASAAVMRGLKREAVE